MRTASARDLCAHYEISKEQWDALRFNPKFVAEVQAAQEALKVEGVSFRKKAQFQADELLSTSWKLVHDPDTSAAVKADLIKSTVRWAGYDKPEGATGGGTGFNIQINLR